MITDERRRLILAAFEERSAGFRSIALRRARSRPDRSSARERTLAPQNFVVHRNGSDRLTPRQVDVLVLIARGASNDQVALALAISAQTVKTHVKHLLVSLDASSRAEAVATAFCRGLLCPSPVAATGGCGGR